MVGGVIIQGRLLEMRTLILESGAVVVSSGNELHDWNKSKKKSKTLHGINGKEANSSLNAGEKKAVKIRVSALPALLNKRHKTSFGKPFILVKGTLLNTPKGSDDLW